MPLQHFFSDYEPHASSPGDFTFCPRCSTQMQRIESGGKIRPTCPNCGFVQFNNPAPAVSILIVDDDHVLLGRRTNDPGKGLWSTPSGYIEYDDDFLQAAVREAKEETGLDVEILSILNVSSDFLSPRWHFLTISLLVRPTGGVLTPSDEMEILQWFPVGGPLPELAFKEDAYHINLYASQRAKDLIP